ncbi:hypothetical protein [Gordonia cholesterolivorans]|uniref:hypothetical protein n=1 Tax=Gordonia cholesterolivorans TaxID=559625 RepID=UPI0031F8AF5A
MSERRTVAVCDLGETSARCHGLRIDLGVAAMGASAGAGGQRRVGASVSGVYELL